MDDGFLKVALLKEVPQENVKISFPTAAQTLGSSPSIFREKLATK
ncbi:hypothetical protein THH46_07735 [Pseudomonas sp. NA13]